MGEAAGSARARPSWSPISTATSRVSLRPWRRRALLLPSVHGFLG